MGNACTRCWYRRVSIVEHYLIIVFRKWGYFVSKYPLHVIIGSLIFTVICCIGVAFIESETDTINLYVPEDSISFNNWQRYLDSWNLYEDQTAPFDISVTPRGNNHLASQENIFTAQHLTEYLRIHNAIMDIQVEYKDNLYGFEDLCYRHQNDNCFIQSILEFYDFNQTQIEDSFLGDSDLHILYPVQFSLYSDTVVSMVVILGQNITINDMNHVTATPAFASFYALDKTLFDPDLISLFETEYLQLMQRETPSNTLFDIVYSISDSFNRELDRAIGSDIISFFLSFILIGVFASFILMRFKRRENGKCCKYTFDTVRNRARMSIVGILSTCCAIFASFGIVGGLCRVKWNPVVSVSPFLLVGLGVDDMFVLLRAYELTDPSQSIHDRIAITMQRGGISILFTSITDLVAFSVGATSPFGSISGFCLYCGVGVFLDFLFQVTFFLGVMVYDSRQKCCVPDSKEQEEREARGVRTVQLATTTTAKDVKSVNNDVQDADTDIDFSDSDTLLSYMIHSESASVLMKKLADWILESVIVKIVIVLLFVAYLIGALYGALELYAYQDPIDLVPSDSYLKSYFNVYEAYFNQIGQPMNIVLNKPLDYSDNAVFKRVDELVLDLQNDKCFETEEYLTYSWIHSFRDYLLIHYGNNTNQSLFYNVLYSEYLDSEEGERYIESIWNTIVVDGDVFDGMFNMESIGSSSYQYIDQSRISIHITSRGVRTDPYAKCLDNYKAVTSKYEDLGAYYYLYFAVVAESDLVTIKQTIRSLIYAMIAACVISVILIPYPIMTIFVMSTVGQILFGVLGYMSLWGLPINTTTMINVVISVGFSVDNAAHFCHAFMNAPLECIPHKLSPKQERKARVLFALNSVGMPILAGDISTIVALLPLAGSDSEIFSSFWKCISLVMLFGAAHSVLYLPVILSVVGPVGIQDILKDKQQSRETENPLKVQQDLSQNETVKPKTDEGEDKNEKEKESKTGYHE